MRRRVRRGSRIPGLDAFGDRTVRSRLRPPWMSVPVQRVVSAFTVAVTAGVTVEFLLPLLGLTG